MLKFSISCILPPDRKDIKWGKANIRDSYLWENESVELFFYGAGNDEYFQFIMGPENALADFCFNNESRSKSNKWAAALAWNCPGVKYNATRTADGWKVKITIPLSSLKFAKPAPDKSMRVNFCRNHYYRLKGERKYRWEQSCWQPTYGEFSNLKYFGKLIIK